MLKREIDSLETEASNGNLKQIIRLKRFLNGLMHWKEKYRKPKLRCKTGVHINNLQLIDAILF
ncbi:hypothetical protein [Desulfobacterium sp. N47]|uniref:Uncharacterized protein n=1 Tax=uncultured Desulfobacterium sp. TaxID=201089 RepID=E1YLH0_9BACT|nr:unknown protein [uncultured Desulfobacterium sp.]